MSDEEEDAQPSVKATEDWVVDRCGVEGDITACTELALPGYTSAFPKIHSLGTSLLAFAGLTSLDVSRNCLASFEGLSSLPQLQRLNFYFNQVVALEDLARLRANRKLSNLDCRLNPMARNHPNFRLYALHTLPHLERLDERDVRPAERRQALAYDPPAPGGTRRKAPASGSERSSWGSSGGDGGQAHASASLQRAARALLQQDDDDDDDDDDDESSYSESDREPRHGVARRHPHQQPARRHDAGASASWYSRADDARDYSAAPASPMHGIQPPQSRQDHSPARGGNDSLNSALDSSFDQAPQAIAAVLAKCESEQRRRQAAEAELDELRAHMRSATQDTARLRRDLADAKAAAQTHSAERETDGAEALRWRQRAEAAEARVAKVEEDAAAQLVKHEAAALEVDRLQQQLATSQELHGTMVEERAELVAQVESAKGAAQTAATAAAEREKKAVGESRSLRNEITVAERYLEEARHRIELLSTELSNAKENAAREASRNEQTTELTTMLREAHATLVATNDRLRKEYDALHNRYNMDADQWKRNFAELKKQYESYSDLGQLTASILQASPAPQVDEANVSGLPSRGYHSDGDIAAGARGTGTAYEYDGTHSQTRAGLVPPTGLGPR